MLCNAGRHTAGQQRVRVREGEGEGEGDGEEDCSQVLKGIVGGAKRRKASCVGGLGTVFRPFTPALHAVHPERPSPTFGGVESEHGALIRRYL